MEYKVLITQLAKDDLINCLIYLAFDKKNPQAAESVELDFYDTLDKLPYMANSFSLIATKLNKYGFRKIPFVNKHNYYLIYHIDEKNQVIVDRMYHDLQNPQNIG